MNYLKLLVLFGIAVIVKSTDTSEQCMKCHQMVTRLRNVLGNSTQYGQVRDFASQLCMMCITSNQDECTR